MHKSMSLQYEPSSEPLHISAATPRKRWRLTLLTHGGRLEWIDIFFFFFFSLVTGPRRSLSLKLSDARVSDLVDARWALGVDRHCRLVAAAGSHLRLIDSCITQLKAQGPSRTCNESKEEDEEGCRCWCMSSVSSGFPRIWRGASDSGGRVSRLRVYTDNVFTLTSSVRVKFRLIIKNI